MAIERLQLEIKTSSATATTAIGKLIKRLQDLEAVCASGAGLDNIVDKLEMVANAAGVSGACGAMSKCNSAFKEASKSATDTGKSMGDLGKKASSASGGITKIFSSLKRIALYRLARIIVKETAEAFKIGIQNYAKYSEAFNATMSELAGTTLQLKNALGTAAAPIINAITPAIIYLENCIISVCNEISKMFALLNGSATYSIATKQQKDYAASLDKTSKSAKTLSLGIDELNVISDSSGSGGSGNTEDVSKMFTEVETTSSAIFDRIKSIASAFEPVREALASLFNKVLEIWESVKSKVLSPIMTYILDNLVPAISNTLASAISFIENLLTSVFRLIEPYLPTIEQGLELVVDALIELLDILAETFDFASVFVVGLTDLILGNITWEQFLTNLSETELAERLRGYYESVKSIVNSCLEYVSSVVSRIYKKIVDTISPIVNWVKTNVIQPILNIIESFRATVTHVFEALWIVIKAIFIVAEAWFNHTVIIPISNLVENLSNMVQTIARTCWGMVQVIWAVVKAWFEQFVTTPIGKIFNSVFTSIWTAANTAWATVKGTWLAANKWFTDHVVEPIKKTFNDAWESIKSGFETVFNHIPEIAKTVFDLLIARIEGVINRAIEGVNWFVEKANSIAGAAAALTGDSWTPFDPIMPVTLPRLMANGGLVDEGQLFIAREAGAEMVGSVGNHTAVANNDQIVEGITAGVATANVDLLVALNTLINAVESKDFRVLIGDKEIGMANDRYTSSRGVRVNTGVFANAY